MERAEQVPAHDPSRRGAVDHPHDPPAAPPAHEEPLSLAGVSDDHARLLLADARGGTYTLDVTPTLRAALRLDAPRPGRPDGRAPGRLETPMDHALRPRDIQARIRAGETAEQVAQVGQTSVDKIMAFVAPVLAERAHVAERAQRSTVRRTAGEGAGGGRTLGRAVETHLRALNVDPESVEWDAWRREDGRWTLSAAFALPVRTGAAHFTFDVPGNYVTLDDADARWLIGEAVAAPAPARDDLQSVRERRLSGLNPVGPGAEGLDDELPLGDDAMQLVAEPAPVAPAAPAAPAPDPVAAFLDDTPTSDDPEVRHEAADAAAEEPDPAPAAPSDAAAEAEPEPQPEPEPAPRRTTRKKGRASVPSWDEIMFGPGSD